LLEETESEVAFRFLRGASPIHTCALEEQSVMTIKIIQPCHLPTTMPRRFVDTSGFLSSLSEFDRTVEDMNM
jgi:hypothetical protein